MPRIQCRYLDCIYLDDGYCGTGSIELDPDEGCLTFTHIGDIPEDQDWEDEELDDFWEDDDPDLYIDEVDQDDWLHEDNF
jgi:hypothetical protein